MNFESNIVNIQENLKNIFLNFLDNYDGFESSFNAKIKYQGKEDISKTTYGEFTSTSLNSTINFLRKYKKLDKTENIIDLGSGIGKVVVALHYTNLFKNIYGVEIFKGLADDSKKLILEYKNKYKKDVENIKIFNDDILNLDLSKFDIIISNTSVDNELKNNIIKKINKEAEKNTIIISAISKFEDNNLKLLESKNTLFSWGESHVHFSIKI